MNKVDINKAHIYNDSDWVSLVQKFIKRNQSYQDEYFHKCELEVEDFVEAVKSEFYKKIKPFKRYQVVGTDQIAEKLCYFLEIDRTSPDPMKNSVFIVGLSYGDEYEYDTVSPSPINNITLRYVSDTAEKRFCNKPLTCEEEYLELLEAYNEYVNNNDSYDIDEEYRPDTFMHPFMFPEYMISFDAQEDGGSLHNYIEVEIPTRDVNGDKDAKEKFLLYDITEYLKEVPYKPDHAQLVSDLVGGYLKPQCREMKRFMETYNEQNYKLIEKFNNVVVPKRKYKIVGDDIIANYLRFAITDKPFIYQGLSYPHGDNCLVTGLDNIDFMWSSDIDKQHDDDTFASFQHPFVLYGNRLEKFDNSEKAKREIEEYINMGMLYKLSDVFEIPYTFLGQDNYADPKSSECYVYNLSYYLQPLDELDRGNS